MLKLKVAKKKYISKCIFYTHTYGENFMKMLVFLDKAIYGIAFIISRYLEVPFPQKICFLSTYTPVKKLWWVNKKSQNNILTHTIHICTCTCGCTHTLSHSIASENDIILKKDYVHII